MTVGVVTGAGSGMGRASVERLRDTVDHLVAAAGLSPTMADPRRIIAVNLVGTVLLLDAFEPLVAPGSAAVCVWPAGASVAVG